MDHGYQVEPDKTCRAITKKVLKCQNPALLGIDMCALHAGLAKAKGKPGYGDQKALEAYKRAQGVRAAAASGARR